MLAGLDGWLFIIAEKMSKMAPIVRETRARAGGKQRQDDCEKGRGRFSGRLLEEGDTGCHACWNPYA